MTIVRPRWATLGAVLLAQAGLVVAAVAPQLSARVRGEEIRLAVTVVDPIDPFRGAYVDLDYPGLRTLRDPSASQPDPGVAPGERGTAYVLLRRDGDVWVQDGAQRERPAGGTYLACDDGYWRLRCGIESWFLPQGRAASLGRALADGDAVAVVRVDGRGNAALVRIEAG